MKDSKQKLKYDTKYESSPEQVKNRELRNTARQAALKAGTVTLGDKKDVDHKTPIGAGGTNAPGNTRVISETQNRGWRAGNKGADSYKPKKV
jgi:hypothetical protein